MSTHFLCHDEIFEKQALTFPGGVTNIVKCQAFHISIHFCNEGKPDWVMAESTFFKMLQRCSYCIRCFFKHCQFLNEFKHTGTVRFKGSAYCNIHKVQKKVKF